VQEKTEDEHIHSSLLQYQL